LPSSHRALPATGYEYLQDLCALRADSTALRSLQGADPVTNRVAFIAEQLEAHGVAVELDRFEPVERVPDFAPGRPSLVNVTATFAGVDPSVTTVFLAHHDVVNPKSENCQDNSASVTNLLDLGVRLARKRPRHNVVIAFVDGEELCAPRICGSQRLARCILEDRYGSVQYAVNLELTAGGAEPTISYQQENALSKAVKRIHPHTHRLRTPYNDAVVLESAGIASACLGILDEANLEQVQRTGFCGTWFLCHSQQDTFAASAVEADMERLVDYLGALI
jgi:hypothetical protein